MTCSHVYIKIIIIVEIIEEAEFDSSYIGVPTGVHSASNLAAHLRMILETVRGKLEGSSWQNCYKEIPLQLNYELILNSVYIHCIQIN